MTEEPLTTSPRIHVFILGPPAFTVFDCLGKRLHRFKWQIRPERGAFRCSLNRFLPTMICEWLDEEISALPQNHKAYIGLMLTCTNTHTATDIPQVIELHRFLLNRYVTNKNLVFDIISTLPRPRFTKSMALFHQADQALMQFAHDHRHARVNFLNIANIFQVNNEHILLKYYEPNKTRLSNHGFDFLATTISRSIEKAVREHFMFPPPVVVEVQNSAFDCEKSLNPSSPSRTAFGLCRFNVAGEFTLCEANCTLCDMLKATRVT